MAKMVKRTCGVCGCEFEARKADVNRGWGKWCSKSCKATRQTKNQAKNTPRYFD